MGNIELSIIIPVYNVAPYLMRNYQSILEQDYENYEIIYVNDGSTDDSLSILRDIESSNDRVQVIDIAFNGGVANARNVGLSESIGKYIYFLDPDDYLLNGLFKEAIPVMEEENVDMLLFGMKEVYPDGYESIRSLSLKRVLDKMEIKNDFPNQYFNTNVFSPCNKIYNRLFIEKNNLFFPKLRIAEDAIFNIRIYKNLNKMVTLNKIYYIYAKREGSAMNSEPTQLEIKQRFDSRMIEELNKLLNEEWHLKSNIPFYQRLDNLSSKMKYINTNDISKLNDLYVGNKKEDIPVRRKLSYIKRYFIISCRAIINKFLVKEEK